MRINRGSGLDYVNINSWQEKNCQQRYLVLKCGLEDKNNNKASHQPTRGKANPPTSRLLLISKRIRLIPSPSLCVSLIVCVGGWVRDRHLKGCEYIFNKCEAGSIAVRVN